MIGFIVIGKNEGQRLVSCLDSIKKTVDENRLADYEIIYVDSRSTDESVEGIRGMDGNLKIYSITGKASPAIGRKIGAAEANADIYCFVDGDMEIIPGFFQGILDDRGKLMYPFLSGQFENIYYDQNNQRTGSELYVKAVISGDKYQITTGGLFLIDRDLWDGIGGMDTRFITGEDLDLGLRLARRGKMLLRKKELLALHHTRHYKSKSRMWKDLIAGKTLYARGLLYRKHLLLLNPYIFKRMMRSDPTFLLLIACGILSLVTRQPYIMMVYLAGILAATFLFRKMSSLTQTLSMILYQIVRDIFTTLAFFFFYPRKADLQYERLK